MLLAPPRFHPPNTASWSAPPPPNEPASQPASQPTSPGHPPIQNDHKKVSAQKKATETVSVMQQRNTQTAMGTIDLSAAFNPSFDDSEDRIFQLAPGVRTAIVTMQANFVDLSLEAWPYRGHPCVITSFVGEFVCAVLGQQVVIENDNLQGWLSGASYDALAPFPAYHIKVGDSVLVPLGHTPVILPLPGNVDFSLEKPSLPTKQATAKEKDRNFVSVGITPLYDESLIKIAGRNSCLGAELSSEFPTTSFKCAIQVGRSTGRPLSSEFPTTSFKCAIQVGRSTGRPPSSEFPTT